MTLIFSPQRRNPQDFDDALTFPLTPLAAQSFYFFVTYLLNSHMKLRGIQFKVYIQKKQSKLVEVFQFKLERELMNETYMWTGSNSTKD